MITLEKYKESDFDRWNDFVRKSKNGIFLFDRNYMDYHKSRFEDASLIFSYKNKIIAVLPANASGTTVFSHQGLTFGSLVMSKKILATQVQQIFDLIVAYYRGLGYSKISYKKTPSIFASYPSEEDLYALFQQNAKLYRRDLSSIIDLSSRIPFSETKKQNCAKCKQENIQIDEIFEPSQFWALLEATLQKFDTLPVHSLTEIEYLRSLFQDRIRIFGAFKDENLLAGTVIYNFDQVVHTQYMAANDGGRKLGALDYLIEQMIGKVVSTQKYLSFGISTVDEGKIVNEGLLLQKEMFGARAIVLDHYELNLIQNS